MGISRGISFTSLYPLFRYIPLRYNEVRVYLRKALEVRSFLRECTVFPTPRQLAASDMAYIPPTRKNATLQIWRMIQLASECTWLPATARTFRITTTQNQPRHVQERTDTWAKMLRSLWRAPKYLEWYYMRLLTYFTLRHQQYVRKTF